MNTMLFRNLLARMSVDFGHNSVAQIDSRAFPSARLYLMQTRRAVMISQSFNSGMDTVLSLKLNPKPWTIISWIPFRLLAWDISTLQIAN